MKNNGGDVGDNTTEGNSKKNDKGLTATDSKLDNNNDDDDDDEKIILTMPRVIRNCISFLCVILIVSLVHLLFYISLLDVAVVVLSQLYR